MRSATKGTIVGLLLLGVTSAIGLSAQGQNAANPLIGTWKFNASKSKMNLSLPPRDLTRIYEDRGNGVYIFTQIGHDAAGYKIETLYVAKEDGTDYPLVRLGADDLPAGFISFKTVDAVTAQQTEKGIAQAGTRQAAGNAPRVTATATRKLSADGKTMTLTVRALPQAGGQDDAAGTAAAQKERPADEVDVMVFDKIS